MEKIVFSWLWLILLFVISPYLSLFYIFLKWLAYINNEKGEEYLYKNGKRKR
jgi:hypothetical protein